MYFTLLGYVPFDERSHKLVTLAVKSYGSLGREGSEFVNQLTTSVVGGRSGRVSARKETECSKNVSYRQSWF